MKQFTLSLLTYLCLLSINSIAQTPELDSLISLLPSMEGDTHKVHLLNKLSTKIRGADIKQATRFGEQALSLSEQLDFEKGQADAYYYIGAAAVGLGEIDKAIECGKSSARLAERLQKFGKLSRANNLLGAAYNIKGDKENAISFTLKAAEIADQAGDDRRSAYAFLTLGNLWYKEDVKQAQKYYLVTLEKAQTLNNKSLTADALHNLGNIALLENQSDEAISYLESARAAAKEVGNMSLIDASEVNLAVLYISTARYTEALDILRSGLAKLKNQEGKIEQKKANTFYINLGKTYQALEQADSAIYYYSKSQLLAEKLELTESLLLSHRQLAELYELKGNKAQALQHIKTCMALKNAQYDEAVRTQLADASTRYETEKKEAQIIQQELELVRQKSNRNLIIIGGLLLLALTAGIFQYFFYRQKRKKREVEIALASELTEAKRLRQLDDMKTQFFTNVSHELRTPLTLIMSPLEGVLKKLKQVNLEPDLKLAYRNSQHLHNLVTEVLDLSKLEAGKLEIEPTEVQLLPLLRRIFYSFQSLADLKTIALELETKLAADYAIKIDIPKLEKILNNLVSNAVKFTPNGGQIKLIVDKETSGSILQFTVLDTGEGIHPDDLPHIFDRFYQSKEGKGRGEGGTGIGLALANQLAQLLGGKLEVESQLDKGSRFCLSLPIEDLVSAPSLKEVLSEEATAPPVSTYEPVFINGKKPRLLIVEDNPEMSDYLSTSLAKHYDCKVAFNGEEALQQLENQDFDLITSDVMMPKMDGFHFRGNINQQEKWKRIPFILLTARTLEADKLKGFQLGIDDYITKPFSLPELEARIHNLLQNKNQRKQFSEEPKENDLPREEQLLKVAEQLVLKHLNDSSFSVTELAKRLGYGSRNLSRVMGRLTGLSPVQFILEVRLQKARQLLESRQFATVTEVRYEVGIDSASYFTKKFTERFGKNPKMYL